MRNASLFRSNVSSMVTVIGILVSLSMPCWAQTTAHQHHVAAGDWKNVEGVFGFPGVVLPGDVIRFNMPRKDLHVTLGGVEIKPGLALGAWAAFHWAGMNDAMVMGDLVLTEDEVAPAMKRCKKAAWKLQLCTII